MSRYDGRTPLSLLKTEAGERFVEEPLYQIDEGVFRVVDIGKH